MAYTLHGHHITGTKTDSIQRTLARCGGPMLCSDCAKQAAAALSALQKDDVQVAHLELSMHDESTLYKVNDALADAGLSIDQIRDAINSMQNYGILFRERVEGINAESSDHG